MGKKYKTSQSSRNKTHTLTKQQPSSRNKDDDQPHKPPVSTADKNMDSNKRPTPHSRDIQATYPKPRRRKRYTPREIPTKSHEASTIKNHMPRTRELKQKTITPQQQTKSQPTKSWNQSSHPPVPSLVDHKPQTPRQCDQHSMSGVAIRSIRTGHMKTRSDQKPVAILPLISQSLTRLVIDHYSP